MIKHNFYNLFYSIILYEYKNYIYIYRERERERELTERNEGMLSVWYK